MIVCDGAGGTKCSDTSGDSVEKCNRIDDDCRNGNDDRQDQPVDRELRGNTTYTLGYTIQ